MTYDQVRDHEWKHIVLRLLEVPLKDHERAYLEGLKGKDDIAMSDKLDVLDIWNRCFG